MTEIATDLNVHICKQTYTDSVKIKYNKLNVKGNSKWETFREVQCHQQTRTKGKLDKEKMSN